MKKDIYMQSLFNRFNSLILVVQKSLKRRHTMKSLLKKAAVLALALGFTAQVRAAVSDSLTVTITPNAFYAVDIDTANVSLDLGTVDLAASTQTVQPSTVTIQSTYATTDLRLQGVIASAGTPWTFDADTSSNESDSLQAWGVFTTVARSSAPTQTGGYFSGTQPGVNNSDVISTTNRYVGTQGGVTNHFEADSGDFAFKDMDSLPPSPAAASLSHLWLRFRLPSASTTVDAQNITITLTAVQPN